MQRESLYKVIALIALAMGAVDFLRYSDTGTTYYVSQAVLHFAFALAFFTVGAEEEKKKK